MSVSSVEGRESVQHVRRRKAKSAPASNVIPRLDIEEDFSDVMGGDLTRFKLENEVGDRRYAFAEETADDLRRYQSGEMGVRYKIEYYEGDEAENALRPVGSIGTGLKKGDMIRVGPHVVVSCDRAKWEKRQRMEASTTMHTNRTRMKARGAVGAKSGRVFRRDGQLAPVGEDVVAGEHGAGWDGLGDRHYGSGEHTP